MRSSRIFMACGLFACCASLPAVAGIYDKCFEIGVSGGIQSGDNNQNVSSGSSYGLKFAYAISQRIMIELSVDKYDTTRDITGFAGPPSQPANQVEFSNEAGTDFLYIGMGLTANFLTESDSATIPYVSVGLGSVVEERAASQFCLDLKPDADPNSSAAVACSDITPDGQVKDPNQNIANPDEEVSWQTFLDEKDSGTLLTVGIGARTFFNDWFAVRYEVRYYHHDTFDQNQDAFEATAGATFVLGGRR